MFREWQPEKPKPIYKPHKRSGLDLAVTLLFTLSFWGYALFLAAGISGFGGFLIGRWSMAGQKLTKQEQELEEALNGEDKPWVKDFWPEQNLLAVPQEEGEPVLRLEDVKPGWMSLPENERYTK